MKEIVNGRTYLINILVNHVQYRGASYKVYTIYEDTDKAKPVIYLGTHLATNLIPDDKLVYHYLDIASKE